MKDLTHGSTDANSKLTEVDTFLALCLLLVDHYTKIDDY